MRSITWKCFLTALVLVLLLSAVLPFMNRVVFHNPMLEGMEQQAVESTDNALIRAAAAYGVARGINAVVSIIQDSEVNIAVASLALGEVLDPVNDIIERFSTVAVVAMASLGVQKVLIAFGPWIGQYLLLPAGLLLALALIWWGRSLGPNLRVWCVRMLAFFLVFQLAMPLVTLTNSLVYDRLLSAQYDQAVQELKNEQAALADATVENGQGGSWWERFKQNVSIAEMQQKIDRLKSRTSDIVDSCIALSVVFVVHSLLLPVGMLWLLLRLAGWVLRTDLVHWVAGFLPPPPGRTQNRTSGPGYEVCDM